MLNDYDYNKIISEILNKENQSELEIKTNNKHICEICDERIFIVKGKELCPNCGAIFSNKIDQKAEWRFDSEGGGEDKTRCGQPINNMLLQTSYSSGFSLGPEYSNKKIYLLLKKIWLWHSKPYSEKALNIKFNNIETKCKLYNIPNYIIENAQKIFYDINSEIEKKNNIKTRGFINQGLQAASVYFACIDANIPKTNKEIAYIFEIDNKYVSNGIKQFKTIMDKLENYKNNDKSSIYIKYINNYLKLLNFTPDLVCQTILLIETILEKKLLDNNIPNAIIAGCIYYIVIINGINNIHKINIENICNISSPTITKICDKLISNMDLLELITFKK